MEISVGGGFRRVSGVEMGGVLGVWVGVGVE